jgi:general secretion pathway protein F
MQFEIRSVDKASGIHTMMLDAHSLAQAKQIAIERGLRVLTIAPKNRFLTIISRRGNRDFSVSQFSQELLTLLDAGLSLVESIETLSEKESKPQSRELLERLVKELYRGSSFSKALTQFTETFPPLYVATVRASERTGGLSESLGKYVIYQEQIDSAKKKVISASIYPVVLLVAGLLVIGFLLGYVVPKFARIFEDLGGEVPWMSKLLIMWGRIVTAHGSSILAIFIVFVALVIFWFTRKETPMQVLRLLERIPAMGEKIRIYQLARFYRSLGMLLRGGMPALSSLELVTELLPGTLQKPLTDATQMIREGSPISEAMDKCRLTSPVSARLLRVGERTGQMGEIMERIAIFYDGEISQWIDWFVRLFEPILMIIIGSIIGFIVVVMYFPIFELAGSIK